MPKPDTRRRTHQFLQSTNDSEDEVEGALLVGWIVVAEWMDEDGAMWLTKLAGRGAGESSPASWQQSGYLHEALYDWPEGDET